MNHLKKKVSFGVFAIFGIGLWLSPHNANAEAELQLSKWVESVKISGDLRLRHEDFHKKTSGQVDRSRQRFRFRLNMDFTLPNKFFVKTGLASGTGEQGSTNQSFDNLSSQKSVWIDKVYLGWVPLENLKLQGGRMDNPLWRLYSSDVVWDTDVNPEGFSEGYSRTVGFANVFVNALQMVVDEDSGNNTSEGLNSNTTQTLGNSQRDQWMLAHQMGFEIKLPSESKFKFAYTNYDWINERFGDFGGSTNEGNRRVFSSSGSLVNNFNVSEFTGGLSGALLKIPIQVQGTYVKNTAARNIFSPKEDTGWQAGVIIGKAGAKKGWEVAYFRKHVRSDATVADLADADFGDGGTNREGQIFWGSYSPLDWMTLSAKYLQTKVINAALSPGLDDVNRLQLDTVVKF